MEMALTLEREDGGIDADGNHRLIGFHQNWITGEDEKRGISFEFNTGIGNAYLQLFLRVGETSVHECINIEPLVQEWVAKVVDKIEAEKKSEDQDGDGNN
jgi:hypothetical protein